MMIRIGFGYDVHPLVEGRKLIIGGVEIPFTKGLLGHSDADVLYHAIADAFLGSLALGDIGQLFPDNDERYRGIDSGLLLQEVYRRVRERGYCLNNLDAVIVAQKPKLLPFIQKMRENLAVLLNTAIENISVKATTTEGLGFAGREEGIAAYAVITVKEVLENG
ncbi:MULTISPECIES: 2-C-methyl-D-erythritol 2,4-cyclodiphosphate synthase [Carboxydothermus]|uniref:2-C-methyl-D-erythritol 2,4-cyclodiphosphate synthase n=3 Tax=Thermoanaerobacteraceae TaxID=186814 RepID=ISPF_CARHZ|nr:2-C-methyl-D-erythritol 2,4-cyclodiphosphate synthase [Carboxydothermus ferrireducens]Q3A9N8.1 RecName: Full=2-C-methyl-D-erythritol 2,4-cyclodiphosphate synthase; Short=MECDP-synthase; Short=MECPP-synthase; Short=MECPS [Carboxydothermus hydrogenoformans Z-2901]ABB15690.1 2C-methyl-D-erythritol 2,4-cyclodiphosphate synthase [Carboxydothermus hydrogenoformans Z-2901]NYE57917.1 2-C-methyl-D-erythritol 2,4-cyclodiphosphate synthase [Carboxydothermus ferrireducens DSM 11255]